MKIHFIKKIIQRFSFNKFIYQTSMYIIGYLLLPHPSYLVPRKLIFFYYNIIFRRNFFLRQTFFLTQIFPPQDYFPGPKLSLIQNIFGLKKSSVFPIHIYLFLALKKVKANLIKLGAPQLSWIFFWTI